MQDVVHDRRCRVPGGGQAKSKQPAFSVVLAEPSTYLTGVVEGAPGCRERRGFSFEILLFLLSRMFCGGLKVKAKVKHFLNFVKLISYQSQIEARKIILSLYLFGTVLHKSYLEMVLLVSLSIQHNHQEQDILIF